MFDRDAEAKHPLADEKGKKYGYSTYMMPSIYVQVLLVPNFRVIRPLMFVWNCVLQIEVILYVPYLMLVGNCVPHMGLINGIILYRKM